MPSNKASKSVKGNKSSQSASVGEWHAYVRYADQESSTDIVHHSQVEDFTPPSFQPNRFYNVFWSGSDSVTLQDFRQKRKDIPRFSPGTPSLDPGFYMAKILLVGETLKQVNEMVKLKNLRSTVASRSTVSTVNEVSTVSTVSTKSAPTSSCDSGVSSKSRSDTSSISSLSQNDSNDFAPEGCSSSDVIELRKEVKTLKDRLRRREKELESVKTRCERLEEANLNLQGTVLQFVKDHSSLCTVHSIKVSDQRQEPVAAGISSSTLQSTQQVTPVPPVTLQPVDSRFYQFNESLDNFLATEMNNFELHEDTVSFIAHQDGNNLVISEPDINALLSEQGAPVKKVVIEPVGPVPPLNHDQMDVAHAQAAVHQHGQADTEQNTWKIYEGIFIDKRAKEVVEFKTFVENPIKIYAYGAVGDAPFIKDAAVYLFGVETLRTHSVSGTVCNATKKKNPNAPPPGPPLPAWGLEVIQKVLERRVKIEESQPVPINAPKEAMTWKERCKKGRVNKEIGQKIAVLNRTLRNARRAN